ncbi:MAG: molybdopterin-dependent oxidoreductase [Halopseudomonas sp.]
MQLSVRCVVASLLLTLSLPCVAGVLDSPNGDVLLTLRGKITHINAQQTAQFDRAMLQALPQHHFTTTTPWTEGAHRYDGVLLKDLLAAVGARGSQLTLYALNDYHATIQLAPLRDYPILVAMKADGRPMRVRDKGPLWLLYPMSDFPQLDSKKHHVGMVWQLNGMVVE